ncbi:MULTISPECIES: MFS transporter [unclassified Haladaptatus]|uniref:MFS transporter n=1 Tax=unclassified Haladaptatus TaxID=2622732 RepID=UPI0023E85BB7|nr:MULTISPECIES: MFS transporter [unclassified Haladaptatus]
MRGTDSRASSLALFANREFLALTSVQFARGFSFATIILALALYADLFSASGIAAGLFGSAYAFVRFFLVLPLGRFIDRGNGKRFLLMGLLIYVGVLVGYSYVNTIEHVIFMRVFQGIGSLVVYLSATAVVGTISPEDGRGLWIGTYNQVRSFSSLTGDIVGGTLLFTFGFQTTYFVLIAVTVIATVAVFTSLRDNPSGSDAKPESSGLETFKRLLGRSSIQALVAFRFLFSFGKTAVVLFLPIFARTQFGMSPLAIGAVLAGGRLTKTVAQGYVGTVSDRVGHLSWFIIAGTVLYAAGVAIIPLATVADSFGSLSLPGLLVNAQVTISGGAIVLFLAYAVLGFADSLRLPTSTTLFVDEGEHYNAVAGSLSLRSIAWQVGAIVGPLGAGIVLDYVSFAAAFYLAAGFTVSSAIAFAALYADEPIPEPVG